MNITFEEFKKTVYYTEKTIVVPLLNKRIDKIDFFQNRKLNFDLISSYLRNLYDENIDRFK